ncbi:MAG TPA: thioesterase family protein [Puia sp.]|nr:thioesterase family protein [Puia sp.]
MARIKIDLPEQFSFLTEIPIRITDLNYGGHVGNDIVLSLIHEARVQFLKHAGYTELDFSGVGLIMSDVAIEFKNEIFYGDIIKASITAKEFSRVGFDIFYKLEKESSNKMILLAIAKTGMVCYNYQTKKIAAVPDEARVKLSS